jgi:transposase
VRDLSCGDTRIFLELDVRRVLCKPCGKVKREQLEFLADNTHFTKRFAYFVGRRCRQATIKDVAKDEAFAEMIDNHWDGIAAHCKPENKDVSLGFVEGLNNKIRVIQRRAYGLRDEEYLRLKILTCMLPKL